MLLLFCKSVDLSFIDIILGNGLHRCVWVSCSGMRIDFKGALYLGDSLEVRFLAQCALATPHSLQHATSASIIHDFGEIKTIKDTAKITGPLTCKPSPQH